MDIAPLQMHARSRASASVAGMLAIALTLCVPAADGEDQGAAQSNTGASKAVVAPYESRPPPSHRVSLTDGRLFFLRKLEETDTGYVLHTMEKETIEVPASEVSEIVELNSGAD